MGTDPIVAFYSGGSDDRGRTLDEILSWPDDRLETVHDYIQWVFPTVAPSGVNPYAPLVTSQTTAAFTSRADLRGRVRTALDRMLLFYGLRREVDARGDVRIEIDAARFRDRARTWLRPGNHNHLRLTRIMQSLAALGLGAEAKALQHCLVADLYDGPGAARITPDTYRFWLTALRP
jgi:hypothetical protein